MTNVFITGATSFIGTSLIKELYKKNYNIYAIIRKDSNKIKMLSKYKKIHIIGLNMEDIEMLPLLVNEHCDIFFHFAWNGTRGDDRNNIEMQNNNSMLSFKALEVANTLGCKIFFTSGSQAEYGNQDKIVNETDKCNPLSAYGKFKLKFYLAAKNYCKANNIKLFEPRFFSIYGENDYKNTLIMSCIEKMKHNESIDLSSCNQLWNYLYVKDATNALVALIESNSEEGIYNISSDDTRKLKEYVFELKEIMSSKSNLNFGSISNNIVSINPNNNKLKTSTNWKPKYSFSKGINEILKRGNNEEN